MGEISANKGKEERVDAGNAHTTASKAMHKMQQLPEGVRPELDEATGAEAAT
jgi:hypothetical protein